MTVIQGKTMMFEKAACCALSVHNKARCRTLLLVRMHLNQSVAESVVGEFNPIAHAYFVKNFVELNLHRALGDREPLGNLRVVQPFRNIANDGRFAGGERELEVARWARRPGRAKETAEQGSTER